MTFTDRLRQAMLPGKILTVQIGLFRTAVLAETDAGIRCGLAATLVNPEFEARHEPAVCFAGHLNQMSNSELAALVQSCSYTEAAVGLATINASLPQGCGPELELNAEDYIRRDGEEKNVVVVGHFPFVERLRSCVKNLWVLELRPREGDLPADKAGEVIPQADLLAMTATTLINKTFDGLLALRRKGARVMLLGPSTPFSPVLFDLGVDILSGTVVTDPQTVLLGIGQGATVKQLRRSGCVRLVTMEKN